MRNALSFPCAGVTLAATLDSAPGPVGLLIISGGNEIRSGAHRGMAMLAARIAAAGYPVLRFDRRGIGDSDGQNGGYLSSRDDIDAAIAAFRDACPALTHIVAFGNCDAASALVLHQPLAVDALVLANPWTIEQDTADDDQPDLPPASAIKSRYLARLRDPATYRRLLRGDINFGKLAKGVARLVRSAPPAQSSGESLGARVVGAILAAPQPVSILLATGDRTAQAFTDHWNQRSDVNVRSATLSSTSHSFAGTDADWLAAQLLDAVKSVAGDS